MCLYYRCLILGYWYDVGNTSWLDHYNLYDQAKKLLSKAPQFGAHSKQQVTLNCFYYRAAAQNLLSPLAPSHVESALRYKREEFRVASQLHIITISKKKKKFVFTKKLYAHYTLGSLTCRICFGFLWEAKLHIYNCNIKFLGFSPVIV